MIAYNNTSYIKWKAKHDIKLNEQKKEALRKIYSDGFKDLQKIYSDGIDEIKEVLQEDAKQKIAVYQEIVDKCDLYITKRWW